MEGESHGKFFISSRVGVAMSIQMKPLFFISSTIRVTHIRHEFKVENSLIISTTM